MPHAPRFYLWINNEASEGEGAASVTNPFDGSTVAHVALAAKAHLERAVRGSAHACGRLQAMARFDRAALLAGIAAGLREAATEIIDALILEGGKPRRFAEQELARTLATFTWAAEEAKRFAGEIIPMDGMQRGKGYEGYTRREPIGPILGICPFNFPLNLVAHKVAPALAVGNACIIKPATITPISALILGRIVTAAGAPAGSLNVLPMAHEQAEALLADDRIKMVSFTGSAAVGWQLKQRIGKKRLALELGGNSGTIVDASADLVWAAERCALGGFAQAGQSCIAVQRIYAHQAIYDPFVQALKRQAEDMPAGDPRDADVVVGPVISSEAAERIVGWIDEAVANGATIVCGGIRLEMGSGNVIAPTVLTGVKEEMAVCQQEVFGPVVTVTPFEGIDTAIDYVNRSDYGLQASIFSNDLANVEQAVERLRVGGVVVNDFPTYRVDHMPYGGVKDSGMGREGIKSAMIEMSEEKTVVIHHV